MLFLHANGVGTSLAVRIFRTYGQDAIRIITEDPYCLARLCGPIFHLRTNPRHDTRDLPIGNGSGRTGLGVHNLYPHQLATMDRAALEQVVQGRTQTIYLGRGVALARVLTRYKILLHTADRGFAGQVMMDGYWEIWLNQFFARTIRPGMRIIDVGANYGYYTMLFADIATTAGRVVAVEPNPAAAELLRQSVRLNGFDSHVQVIEAALGEINEGAGYLVVPDGEPKNAHLSSQPASNATVHSVVLTTLDHLAVELDRVDFIKIDAEGSEEAIIAGMPDVLHRQKPALVVEFNTARCADPGALLDGLIAIYGKAAYVGYDGNSAQVERDIVLTTQQGEDWMLYFASPAA